ncbi:hypothetical protein CO112_03925 [Candidatus Dojkabacteria bacterium CG_4_9_14_3_um_filter_150_Dojkabacteria_WS6_41_13]|uniref:GP-PDE domain-containing protein n=1 Tax=Candidatus Dojkabacteria bacterium CG_4_10_14_0_2_um_filter_Dojkabacteria_WS6_41_15 TaxID=2014249 RepID=A0A2M7W134_9BACT|nr:MAG: hypothetical protein COZ14_04080 [Candidatus Dojkabacteria bacterium CG_4_10_14_3_um_filter_Dojkabacteria_WS6_41_9]PJA12861.1 MAG: hypothetical protein COX64_04010 [Candidatus Dojkabacteria bacterium CG_4_10_14_0_2_um_filter_Dojkabacteria_WS6_41_15]PJB22514.1 MAG: hypothetical protein CO112_03925 [Candidatus Dojkabacteria bacterium CG_4_9_14_3_um_filter_150_Dojkabacteria_WS6_41_13]
MYLIGHRGNSATAPENTMTSFQMALDLGASGVELDVAFTRDNQIVVFHDVVLDRTTDGKGLLKSKDYDSVKSLDAGSWFSSKFAGEKVPLLEDVFSTFGRSAQRIIVELKGEQEKRQLLATKVISLIEKYTLQEQIQLLVYDFPTLDFLYSQEKFRNISVQFFAGVYFHPFPYVFQIEMNFKPVPRLIRIGLLHFTDVQFSKIHAFGLDYQISEKLIADLTAKNLEVLFGARQAISIEQALQLKSWGITGIMRNDITPFLGLI